MECYVDNKRSILEHLKDIERRLALAKNEVKAQKDPKEVSIDLRGLKYTGGWIKIKASGQLYFTCTKPKNRAKSSFKNVSII